MNIKVQDLMTTGVVTAQPHQTVETLKGKMIKHSIRMIPVVSSDNEPVGVVSVSDLVSTGKEGTPISHIMTDKVYTVPEYEDASIAARIMRNHKSHHLIVTNTKHVIGVIISFDLLKLVDDHRFVIKNPPSPNKGKGKRHKAELS